MTRRLSALYVGGGRENRRGGGSAENGRSVNQALCPVYALRPDGSDKGVHAIIAYRRRVAEAFPDEVATVQAIFVSPEAVTVEWTQSATHTVRTKIEQLGIVEPTGKAFKDLRVVDIFRYRDGKIVSDQQYYDLLTLLRQIGWIQIKPAGRAQ